MKMKILPYLLVVGFLINVNFVFSQQERYLIGFDKEEAIEHAKNEGIPQKDWDKWVESCKARYIHKKRMEVDQKYIDEHTMVMNRPSSPTQTLNAYCSNLGFENLNFSNWTAGYYTNSSGSNWNTLNVPWINATSPAAVVLNQGVAVAGSLHTIYTTPGNDPNCGGPGGPLSRLSPNGTATARIGNDDSGYETERLLYYMTVTPQNLLFTYEYAVVINDGGHSSGEQPSFTVSILDSAGQTQLGGSCGVYQVDATNAGSPNSGYFLSNTGGSSTFNPIYYKQWTTVTLDLSAYVGQTIQIQFRANDCIYGGHFGYAYIDASCGLLNIPISGFCAVTSGSATLVAPPGFSGYQWSGPNNPSNNIPGGNNDTLIVLNPMPGDTFYVQLQNVSGCNSVAQTIIEISEVDAIPSVTGTCAGGSFGQASVAATGGDLTVSYNYQWTTGAPFPGGTPYGGNTNAITNLAPGTYYVHVTSGNCPPADTFIVVNATPPSVTTNTLTFCGTIANLTAPSGNTNYQWYDANGILVPAPIGTNPQYIATGVNGTEIFPVTFLNSSGCTDSLRISLNQVGPLFAPTSTNPCAGGNNGAISLTQTNSGFAPFDYSWNNGSANGTGNTPTAPINIPNLGGGSYTVTVNQTSNPTCAVSYTVNLIPGAISVSPLDTFRVCNGNTTCITPPANYGPNHNWHQLTNGISVPLGNSSNCLTIQPADGSGPNNDFNQNGYVFLDTASNAIGCKSVFQTYIKHTNITVNQLVLENNPCILDSLGKVKVSLAGASAPLDYPVTFNWSGPSISGSPTDVNVYNGGGDVTFPVIDEAVGLIKGIYYLVVTTADGCSFRDTFEIKDPYYSYDTLTYKAIFCQGDTIGTLVAPAGFGSYDWHYYQGTLSNNPFVLPAYDSTLVGWYNSDTVYFFNPESTYQDYYVTYLYNGCKRRSSIEIQVTPPPPFRPEKTVNVFTPGDLSGDVYKDANRVFFPFFDDQLAFASSGTYQMQYWIDYFSKEYSMQVYDRWGKLIFESDDYLKGWDGKRSNGDYVTEGTYFYTVRYLPRCGNDGDAVVKTGFVQVFKDSK